MIYAGRTWVKRRGYSLSDALGPYAEIVRGINRIGRGLSLNGRNLNAHIPSALTALCASIGTLSQSYSRERLYDLSLVKLSMTGMQ